METHAPGAALPGKAAIAKSGATTGYESPEGKTACPKGHPLFRDILGVADDPDSTAGPHEAVLEDAMLETGTGPEKAMDSLDVQPDIETDASHGGAFPETVRATGSNGVAPVEVNANTQQTDPPGAISPPTRTNTESTAAPPLTEGAQPGAASDSGSLRGDRSGRGAAAGAQPSRAEIAAPSVVATFRAGPVPDGHAASGRTGATPAQDVDEMHLVLGGRARATDALAGGNARPNALVDIPPNTAPSDSAIRSIGVAVAARGLVPETEAGEISETPMDHATGREGIDKIGGSQMRLPLVELGAPGLRDLAQQVSEAIRVRSSGHVEIRLDPEELGQLKISFRTTDAGLAVTVHAERADTVDLMRRHMDTLQRELQAIGYDDVALNFGNAGSGPHSGDPEARHSEGTRTWATQTSDQVSPVPAGGGASDRLDLRL